MIKAVLFDTIGTTVKESDPSFMSGCFIKAFAENSIKIDTSDFYQYRGLDKKTAIRTILKKYDYPGNLCENIFHSFENIIDLSLRNFSEMKNAAQLFTFLKSRKIKIGIGTGLPADLFQKIFNYLGWSKYSFDYIGISDVIGVSRPDPAMIFDMMNKLGISDRSSIIKVGDTIADVQEGKNAGVITVALLSGTQTRSDIENAKPDFMISSLAEMKDVIDHFN
jgi:HAD superfamily hydrolase (TIGR01549 family)